MNQRIGKIIAAIILIAGFLGLVIWKLNDRIDYSKYDLTDYIGANDDNGQIADHIKGPEDAIVKIVEYADYQCELCAASNPLVNKLVEEYDGKVAVIFRNFLLSYHANATAAASAANAAGLQGYWKEYIDLLFSDQNSWYYAESTERLNIFINYFNQVTDYQGDVDQFKSDMRSSRVSQKISFDIGAGKLTDLEGTPAYYINGEHISVESNTDETKFLESMRKVIDPLLKEAENNSNNSEDNSNNNSDN